MDHPNSDAGAHDAALRLVIIDDDLFVRTALVRLLDRCEGIRVIGSFADGRDAVDAMSSNPPDLALIDISMPDFDGVETTRLLKDRIPAVKVLALTSLSSERAASDMLEAGAVGFLMKDTPIGAMANSIQAAGAGLSVLSAPASQLSTPLPQATSSPGLTDTEQTILRLIASGLTNAQIAEQVFLTSSTVKYHVSALMTKFGVQSRVALAVRAHETGLL